MRFKKCHTAFLLSALVMPAFVLGCGISRRDYDTNMAMVLSELEQERAARIVLQRAYEVKVHERGRTLSEITERYMAVKEQNDFNKAKLGRLNGDLERLLRDFSELKLVIFANFKGAQANEMILKLNEMQRTVQELLKKSKEQMPVPPQAAPSVPAEQEQPAASPQQVQDKL